MKSFAKGFTLTKKESTLYDYSLTFKYEKATLNNYIMTFDPSLHLLSKRENGLSMFLLGTVMDVFGEEYNATVTIDELFKLWQDDESAFYNKFNELSGSFVLFIEDKESLYAYTDALTTIPIFYDTDKKEISSHPQLFAEAYGYEESEEYRNIKQNKAFMENKDRFVPGLLTPFSNVLQLTPNTRLILPECKVERFFPKEKNTYKFDEGLILEIENFFVTQVDLLCKYNEVAISTTAGFDSRLTFASSRHHREEIYYFTIPYNNPAEYDSNFSHEMLTKLGVDHEILPFNNNATSDFLKTYNRNVSGMSTEFRAQIAYAMECYFPKNKLHVKSNGSESCRCYFRAHNILPKKPTFKLCSQLISGSPDYCKIYEKAFEIIQLPLTSMYDYDFYDLIHWEFRLGKWHALCNLEWSPVQDIILPYNCRKLFCMMFAIPQQMRVDNTLYRKMITDMWPEADKFEYNKHSEKGKMNETLTKFLKYFYYQLVCR